MFLSKFKCKNKYRLEKFCLQHGCKSKTRLCGQESCSACRDDHINCNLVLRQSEANFEEAKWIFNKKKKFQKMIYDKFCGFSNDLKNLMNQSFLQSVAVSPFEQIELKKILSDLSQEERNRYILKEFNNRGGSEEVRQRKTQIFEEFEIQLGDLISKNINRLRQQQLNQFCSSDQSIQGIDFNTNQVLAIESNEESVIKFTKKYQQNQPREKKSLVFIHPSISKCTKVMFRIVKKCWPPCIGIFNNSISLENHEQSISENYTSSNCYSNIDKEMLEDNNEYRLLQFDYNLGDIIQLHYFKSQNLIRISINKSQRYYFLQVPIKVHTWFWGLRLSSEEAMMELLT